MTELLMATLRVLYDIIRPPRGHWVRKLIIMVAFSTALAMFIGQRQVTIMALNSLGYGILFAIGSIIMAATYDYRRHWTGQIAAIFAATAFGLLGWDTIRFSTTSGLVNLVIAWCCVGEAGASRDN